jgi:hypothetical protein
MSEAASEMSGLKEPQAGMPAVSSGVLDRLRERRRRNRAQAETQRRFVVENQTARAIQIESADIASPAIDALLLPPFGARTLTAAQRPQYRLERWENLGLITIQERTDPGAARWLYLSMAAVGFGMLLALFSVLLSNNRTTLQNSLRLLQDDGKFERFVSYTNLFTLGLFILAAGLLVGYILRRLGWLQRAGQAVSLVLVAISVIFVGAVCPALTVMYFSLEEWFLDNPPVNWLVPPATFGRVLQIVFVVVAALLPALLYFLFDRQKVGTVRRTFYRQIVMLDPPIYSSHEAEEKYGHLINEVYGDKSVGYYLVNVGLPIALSSVLIAVGWLMILLPITPDPDMSLSGIFKMFEPRVTPTSFGFLGAYFFTLNMVFRRYVRSDLTPKAYSHITVRLLVTTILVWTVSALPALAPDPSGAYNPLLLILAFCIGVVPETGVKILQEFLRKGLGRFNESLLERDPLTELEGVNLYDRARLSEEGVDNVENLAHHNLIHLLVHTRIPVSRLVDMFDQAILYLHLRGVAPVAPPALSPDGSPAPESEATPAEPPSARDYLRTYGIRTATDLLQAWPAKPDSGRSDFETILRTRSPELADRLSVIVPALRDDDWMPQLGYWREQITKSPDKPATDPLELIQREIETSQGTYGGVAAAIA